MTRQQRRYQQGAPNDPSAKMSPIWGTESPVSTNVNNTGHRMIRQQKRYQHGRRMNCQQKLYEHRVWNDFLDVEKTMLIANW